jgi:hypothetical protein
VLTSVFYFVGLAYESVSESTRFILFVGGIDTLVYLVARAYAMVPVVQSARTFDPDAQVPFNA